MSEENEIRLKHLVIDMGDGTTLELSADKARRLYSALRQVFGEHGWTYVGGGGGSNIREYQNCFPSRGEGIVEVKPWPCPVEPIDATQMPECYPPPESSSEASSDTKGE